MKLIDFWNYFTEWSCKYKRAYWIGLIGIDLPILGFDYGFFAYSADILNFMIAFFRGDMGRVIQYSVGILACILTWERIKQARLVKEQMTKGQDEKKDE